MGIGQVLKTEDGQISLPLVRLTRGKRMVVLVGMSHVAPPQFFMSVRERLLAYERSGFRILYEVIDPHLTFEFESVKDQCRQEMARIVRRQFIDLLKEYDLVYQGDYLRPSPNWFSADLGDEDWKDGRFLPLLRSHLEKVSSHTPTRAEVQLFVRKFVDFFSDQPRNVSAHQQNGEIIIDKRNKIAIASVLNHAECKNIATYWGVAHLPGMTNLLLKAGYEVGSIEWVHFFDLLQLKTKLKAERG